jgi:endonuclease G
MSSSPRLGRKNTPLRFVAFALASITFLVILQLSFFSARAVSPNIVISEFRTRGPNGAADEFVELYNNTDSAVNIGGWKINGSNSSGTTSTRLTITAGTMIPARGHFLATNPSASGGPYSGGVPGNQTFTTGITDDGGIAVLDASNAIIDQVGFTAGSAYKEGSVLTTQLTTNTNRSYERKPGDGSGSTQDTDNNLNDFQLISPSDPQNLASAPTPGGTPGGTPTPTPTPTPNAGALQFSSATYSVAENGGSISITVSRTGGSAGAVAVNYATSNGSATSGEDYTTASGTLNFANGETSKTFSVAILDDAEYEGDETVNLTLSTPTGGATLGTPSTATLTIIENESQPEIVPAGSVVISQIYGGGGNTNAIYTNDFIEIFNRSANPVNLAGWSVQYSSAAGSSWSNRTNLTGTLQPGQYYLISGASGGSNGVALPTANIVGSINMSATTGKVALVRSTTALTTDCPVGGPTVIDFVGYGTSATCQEGPGPAPQLSASSAALRARNGCKDTDYNAVNFTEVTPNPRNSSSPLNVCPAGDEAPEVFSTTPTSGEFNVNLNSNITINFDQVVNVTGSWYQISCGTSGLHTAVVTGGPASFTLNPDTDFAGSEQCTVTVFASAVTDQDAQDPPDNMVANYVFSFNTFVPRDPAEHMVMGNPTGATTDVSVMDNYLMMKDQFALSYNNSRAIPNWTSWHLDASWVTGVSDRTNDFRPDDTLPPGFTRVASGYNFATYGFDRGHMTPSADRTSSETDNRATFLMTNMVPQASGNNQGPWADLENHLRTLLGGTANELYIVSGGFGTGGTSTTGNWNSIVDTGGNTVTVPKYTWKVIMVLPSGDNDVSRVNASTRTFAVIMPNNDNIRPDDWKKYLATVDQVEALTGQNYFSNVPEDIQAVIEARLDDEYNTAPVATGQPVTTAEDTQKQITLSASDFNVNNVLSYSIVDGPQHGTLSTIEGGTLTYTPNGNYNGPDGFTFKANDGGKDSNVATVTINVTPVNDAPTLNGVPASASTDELAPYTFTASASDVDGPSLSFSLTGAPAGASIDSASGVFTWTPTEAQGGTGAPYSFTVSVTDGEQTAEAVISLTVNEVNQNPTLNAIGNKTVMQGGTLTFTAVGADADLPSQTLKYSLVDAPAGATINEDTGVFNWTPTASQVGAVYSFSVSVTDSLGGHAEQSVSVGVGYLWSGVLSPVQEGGVYKIGRTLPIKFRLTGPSAGLTNAVAHLWIAKISDGVAGQEIEADSTSAATADNLFRYDASEGQYILNWSVRGYTPGTYQLRIDLGDGVLRTVTIGLK